MKITAGSFGISGSAYIGAGRLHIEGARNTSYGPEQIACLTTRVESERRFGLLGALVGGALLGVVGLVLLGPVGAAIGVALAVLGSFYRSTSNLADVQFSDGSTLTLECTSGAVKKLVRFRSPA